MKYGLIFILFLLTGCANNPVNGAKSLLDRLEFDEDEYGTFELEGTVDVNPLPLFSSNVHMKLEKHKDAPKTVTEVAP